MAREMGIAVLALVTGAVLLPFLIYYCGNSALGAYEGAGLGRTFGVVWGGLATGSIASWIVVLGPYSLFLLSRLLRLWWRAGTPR
jgi:hypothetical protein